MGKIGLFLALLVTLRAFGQQAVPPAQVPVSSSVAQDPSDSQQQPAPETPSTAQQPNAANPTPPPARDVRFTIPSFARNFFSDQKKIWTFPAQVVTGHHIVPVVVISAATAALVWGVDPVEGRYFRRHADTFAPFNDTFSEHRTTAGTLLIPAGIAGAGLISRHHYLAATGLLALESWVDVDITAEVMRNIADRERPLDIPLNGNYSKTWFKTASSPLNADGSFPSGHTAWGFAVASTISRRYPHHKWVRDLAYGLAFVDFSSRIMDSKHFASDAVFGAILGYSVGRFVVVRQ
ncbi:MAG TPA: phosphatase PAP2 family protein [Bryobacteraceae bacterium]|nr:phosphatase PAP2 family protein [Bryobacteraceae bacterium]